MRLSLAAPPLDISTTVGELPAIIVDASIDAHESSAVIEGGSELVDLSAIDTVDIDLGSVLVVTSGSSAAASSGATVVISDVPHLETSSAPYTSSGLADAAGVTETDTTGELIVPGALAAIDTALLHTEEFEIIDLAATGGTHTDTGFEVVSDTETDDTGASDPSSDPTPSADVAPPTATLDSVESAAGTVPTASLLSVPSVPLSGVSVPLPPVYHSDSESESEMDESQSNSHQFSPPKFRGLTTENAKDCIRQFENYCTYKDYNEAKKMALFKVLLTDSAV